MLVTFWIAAKDFGAFKKSDPVQIRSEFERVGAFILVQVEAPADKISITTETKKATLFVTCRN